MDSVLVHLISPVIRDDMCAGCTLAHFYYTSLTDIINIIPGKECDDDVDPVFSSQMLKAWGAHVTVTCSQNAKRLVRGLEEYHVVDYTAGPVEVPLRAREK